MKVFQGIIESIADKTGLEIEVVAKVVSSFLLELKNRSLFVVWQQVIVRGQKTFAIISAMTTNLQLRDESFPVARKIISLEGNIQGYSEIDEQQLLANENSQRLAAPVKQIPKG